MLKNQKKIAINNVKICVKIYVGLMYLTEYLTGGGGYRGEMTTIF